MAHRRPHRSSVLAALAALVFAGVITSGCDCSDSADAPESAAAAASSGEPPAAASPPASAPGAVEAEPAPPAERGESAPRQLDSESAAAMLRDMTERAEAAGDEAIGEGPCVAALASVRTLARLAPGNRPEPDRASFMAACEALSPAARQCMVMSHARAHRAECQAAMAEVTPAQRAAIAQAVRGG